MAHQSPVRLSRVDAMPLIVAQAGKADGVTVEQVADLCDISLPAARARLEAAATQFGLVKVQRDTGLRGRDVRWFAVQHHADEFRAGRLPGMPAPRSVCQTVDLPTTPRPDTGTRPGAADHRRFGSRRGNRIFYADGTSEAAV